MDTEPLNLSPWLEYVLLLWLAAFITLISLI
jgi:hypothetical protein